MGVGAPHKDNLQPVMTDLRGVHHLNHDSRLPEGLFPILFIMSRLGRGEEELGTIWDSCSVPENRAGKTMIPAPRTLILKLSLREWLWHRVESAGKGLS